MQTIIDFMYFVAVFLDKASHSTRTLADSASLVNEDYKAIKASLNEFQSKNLVQKKDFEK